MFQNTFPFIFLILCGIHGDIFKVVAKTPTNVPSFLPTWEPTTEITLFPTEGTPTDVPVGIPTLYPVETEKPTSRRTVNPTRLPSASPSILPSSNPSILPTRLPSSFPSSRPTSLPSTPPSASPSISPTVFPSSYPTSEPTQAPSSAPTYIPSSFPTPLPTAFPSTSPTFQPTVSPTIEPSAVPSRGPSSLPSIRPSVFPSVTPSVRPSNIPTSKPTRQPTISPTAKPSRIPSAKPTRNPTASPSVKPTASQTVRPSSFPSAFPSLDPSSCPSSVPTRPTATPSDIPSLVPSAIPSSEPTTEPSTIPTIEPTFQPSAFPTVEPSSKPSQHPTSRPSAIPTLFPSGFPSFTPSVSPSGGPSVHPSLEPSVFPTSDASANPSRFPTPKPSLRPTVSPSNRPSRVPSALPSAKDTLSPTAAPTRVPTRVPSVRPTAILTVAPTVFPSTVPSLVPTSIPSFHPSLIPSSRPSVYPSTRPSASISALPTRIPTVVPSARPTAFPSWLPSLVPSRSPSSRPTRVPSVMPSSLPSGLPSPSPSSRPTPSPSTSPSSAASFTPTCRPSESPTFSPSREKTELPSSTPSLQPSTQPSMVPSSLPSESPSAQPSFAPTSVPSSSSPTTMLQTDVPTQYPQSTPTVSPSSFPSSDLTDTPTESPTSIVSHEPSALLSNEPTNEPTVYPSIEISSEPSIDPTIEPSCNPSQEPSVEPTAETTEAPSVEPTSDQPTLTFSAFPTIEGDTSTSIPSNSPTLRPVSTNRPTASPTTKLPTSSPSIRPSRNPSSSPSAAVTRSPSSRPSLLPSSTPTLKPSAVQSVLPTRRPTPLSSFVPSALPSSRPTISFEPTLGPVNPSSIPSSIPTSFPSCSPSTRTPTSLPSVKPTAETSAKPSRTPSTSPTRAPTAGSTFSPSRRPSSFPSFRPTRYPTSIPSRLPSTQPSLSPTAFATEFPSSCPSILPTSVPSRIPTSSATLLPSIDPSVSPTSKSTVHPTAEPSAEYTTIPTFIPTMTPSSIPTQSPSNSPTFKPSFIPTSSPSAIPTVELSVSPSLSPSTRPTAKPSTFPSSRRSLQPTRQPSFPPSRRPTTTPSVRPTICVSSRPTIRPTFSPNSVSDSPTVIVTPLPTSDPSLLPTPTPSQFPSSTPTGVPSARSLLPHIESIQVTATTKSTVTLRLGLTGKRLGTSGYVYCYASTNTSTSTLISILLSYGSSSYFASMDVQPTVTLANLRPVTSYSAYCLMKTTDGFVSSLSDILSLESSFTTGCCIDVVYSNAPTSVYGDTSLYSSQDRSKFTFTFNVGYLPSSGSITVTPVVLTSDTPTLSPTSIRSSDLNVAQGNRQLEDAVGVSVIPSSITFTSSSSSKFGVFYLTAGFYTAGSFAIDTRISGSAASSYSSSAILQVSLIATDRPLPSPVLFSSIFTDTAASILITFDIYTDYAGFGNVFTCSKLFYFAGSAKASCVWLNSTTVQATFGSMSESSEYVIPGSNVTLLGNLLRAQCISGTTCTNNLLASAQTITVKPPVNLLIPTVVLSVSSQVSTCDNLTLDATSSSGNGGRDWLSATWIVVDEASGNNADSIMQYLSSRYSTSKSISQIIVVPNSLLSATTYTFSLTLKNFLYASSTSSKIVQVLNGAPIPSLTVVGGSSFSYYAYQSISINVVGSISSCASSSVLTYSKAVFLNDVLLPTVVSTSLDPRTLSLSAYTLTAGNTYRVDFTATTALGVSSTVSTYIAMKHGNVIASIIGGATRSVPLEKSFTLDASNSYDEDKSSTASLSYSWSCSIATLALFGTDCSAILDSSNGVTGQYRSILNIPSNYLNATLTYTFIVEVSSLDGRQATASVVVTPTLSGIIVAFTTTQTLFNNNDLISIAVDIYANYSIRATWTIFQSGSLVTSVVPITEMSTIFTADEASNVISFPCAFSSNSFVPGQSYTFRLTAYPLIRPSFTSVAELTITINVPPWNGFVVVSPSSGTALSTSFLISTPGWVTKTANYPLEYEFSYQLTSTSSLLVIGSKNRLTYTISTLPSGLLGVLGSESEYLVKINAVCYDTYSAFTPASTLVNVEPAELSGGELRDLFSDSLASALGSYDINNALKAVNIVSSVANTINCTLTPPSYCSSLNRESCSVKANTCGPCKTNYTGIYGYYNTMCVASDAELPTVCFTDNDCLSGPCVSGECTVSSKVCSTSTSDVCSGHGQCVFYDSSGRVSDCLVTNSRCYPVCQCDTGYGSEDCSLDEEGILLRAELRANLCQGVLNISLLQDKSEALLDTLVSAVESSFSPYELTTLSSKITCLLAFEYIANLAYDGYLSASKTSTLSSLMSTFSSFIQSDVFSSLSDDPTYSNVATTIFDKINNAVLSITVSGQSATSLTTDFVQTSLVSSRSSSLASSTIAPPLTDSDIASGSLQQGISLEGDSLSSCYSATGYYRVAISQVLKSPYPGTSSMANPILQMTVYNSPSTTSRRLALTERKETLPFDPLFYITLQFNQKQNFNFSLDILSLSSTETSNFTIPECKIYDATIDDYTSCTGCNISSYTNYNVTYGCSDISLLCDTSASTSGSRKLSQLQQRQFPIKSIAQSSSSYGRQLQEESTSNDDSSTSTGKANIFGALLAAFLSVITSNPFAISLADAIPIIIFVGSLGLLTIGGSLYFLRWDRNDHDYIIYIKKDSHAKKLRESYIQNKLSSDHQKSKKGLSKLKGKFMSNLHVGSLSPHSHKASINPEIDEILNDVTFPKHLLQASSTITLILRAIFGQHVYVAPFFGSSLRRRRILRWINLMSVILSNIFVDTLFFQTFFNGSSYCESLTTEETCLQSINKGTGELQCEWTVSGEEGECGLRPPPSTLEFYIILAFLNLVIALPLQAIVEYFLEEYASAYPDLEGLGISESWLSYLFGSHTKKHLQVHNHSSESHSRHEGKSTNHFLHPLHVYADNLTSEEERKELNNRLREFLLDSRVQGYIPWIDSDDAFHEHDKLNKVLRRMGMNPDGSPSHLTLWQYVMYGLPEKRIERKIRFARAGAEEIIEEMKGFEPNEIESRNALLLQYFILEQVSFYKKYCLRRQFFSFGTNSPKLINPFVWLGVWIFIYGLLAFYLYWAFAWGAANYERVLLEEWGKNFAIVFAQDLAFVQIVKVYIIHVVGVVTVQSQIQNIYNVLHEVALRQHDDHDPLRLCQHLSAACRAARDRQSHNLSAARLLRSLNDNDVERCRETNSVSLGLVILVLAFPSILALISLTMADKILEVIIPGFLSGFLFFNKTLYDISWAVLVAFYGVILLFIFWKTGLISYLYHKYRMTTNSEYERQYRLKDGKLYRHRKKGKSFYELIANFYTIIIHRTRNRQYQISRQWRLKNIPYFQEGYAGVFNRLTATTTRQQDYKHDSSSDDSSSEDIVFGLNSERIEIPSLIQSLYIKSNNLNIEEPLETIEKWIKYDRYNGMLSQLFDNDRMVINTAVEKSSLAREFRNETTTISVEEGLRRILMRLQSYDFRDIEKYRHSYSMLLLEYYNDKHTLEEYLQAIDSVSSKFHPDGIPISSEEKQEIFDEFIYWHSEFYDDPDALIRFQDFALKFRSLFRVLSKARHVNDDLVNFEAASDVQTFSNPSPSSKKSRKDQGGVYPYQGLLNGLQYPQVYPPISSSSYVSNTGINALTTTDANLGTPRNRSPSTGWTSSPAPNRPNINQLGIWNWGIGYYNPTSDAGANGGY